MSTVVHRLRSALSGTGPGIRALRRRPATYDVPVVVLTTRVGAKHLALARWLGIEHYLPKPVDEEAFVQLMAGLTGTATDPARR